MASYIGMDFGGTKLLIGEVNADGQILGKKKYTTGYVNQEAAVDIMKSSLGDYLRTEGAGSRPDAIGIGVIGRVDTRSGEWLQIDPQRLQPVQLGPLMRATFGLPSYVANDDIETVRVQNLAYDNYLYSAYEAFAARVLADYDPVFADCLAGIAREDYQFASQQREHDNFGGWINPYEHTYSTGESLYMATASWAASMLYELTADPQYAADASTFADYVLRCQQAIPVGGLVGFFYRNPQRHSVVHSIHQSREQIFMLAMDALCRTQPDNPGRDRWETSISLYGSYLRNLMRFTAPYGMIPAGIYRSDEPDDAAAFFALHIFPPDDARERFAAQAESGVSVAPGYFVRRFPVWFNIFNGNLAVHTSMGKAAAICARRLGDPELLDIAREQMYWTVGKNPFAQSLIYGEGHRYPELNNFSSGRLMGAMPVGIRTIGDTDEPYWPQINNACYKEVWLTSAGKWFSLLAEIENNDIS